MPMTPAQDGEAHGSAKPPPRRRKRRSPRQRKEEGKRRSDEAPAPPPSPPHTLVGPASGDEDRSAQVQDMVTQRVRKMLVVDAERKMEVAKFLRNIAEEGTLTMESEFGDCDDGSTESVEARKVALTVSQSIVSLSTFTGGKRIRVGSGFVMRWNDSTDRHMIITAATLVRSIDGENTVVPDLMVKVLLPNGNITDGHIFLVDFHYNVAVVEVESDTRLMNVSAAKDIVTRGDVLALGRAYEGGNLMCSRGRIVYQTSTFGCSELLTSCCKITMVGAGGPLVNYSGHVVGINFYEKNQTPYLSIAIVLRILDHYHSFGKIIRPWLGLSYNSLETVPLRVLEHIYQRFPDVDKGLYVSNVAQGSPADVAGLCVGDVLVKCEGKILSTAPEFGAALLDRCKEYAETHDWKSTEYYTGKNISVEVVIKQQRDGCTTSKSISADGMMECHYNRWPAPMPRYQPHRVNVTRCRGYEAPNIRDG
ncbi:unnamed protein product [Urochloa humidicola]